MKWVSCSGAATGLHPGSYRLDFSDKRRLPAPNATPTC